MNNEKFLESASIQSVHDLMIKGDLTCRQLVEIYLERIEKYDQKGPKLNSVILINPNVLEEADRMDRKFKESGFVGSLHGIPVLLKDNVDTYDMATTAGSLSLEGVVPEKDAFLAKQLREAGAIIIAKVNLHEFAVWGETLSSILGQTINPYDLTRSPGGSSGGTGAGIAANFGLIGIGTDTINSIRSPASACSLVGFRPTVGLVSRAGVVPYALTQDTAGPIMKTVEDTAKVLDVISGWDEDDQMTAWSVGNIPKSYVDFLDKDGLRGKRIGILNSFFGKEKIHEEVNEIMYKGIEAMKNQGAILIPIEEDINADELVGDVSLHLYELKTDLSKYLHNLGTKSRVHSLQDVIDSGKFHEGIKENILFANTLDKGTDIYNKRMIKRLEVRNFLVELMAKYDLDALVYPHQKRPVVKVNEPQVDRNGVLGSVTGFPSIVVPGGFTKPTETAPIGIPVGIEFLGREWSEATLFQIAYGFEQATNYRKPPVL